MIFSSHLTFAVTKVLSRCIILRKKGGNIVHRYIQICWLLMQLTLAFTGVPSSWIGKPLHNIGVTNDHGMLFPLSWLISWFLKRTIWLLLLLDQELLTCPKNLGLSSVYWEDFEDTKRVIIIRKSKQDRHQNGQKKQDKRTNNDLPNTYTSS
jgi:hypothetical protein